MDDGYSGFDLPRERETQYSASYAKLVLRVSKNRNESFNDKFRSECLNYSRESIHSLQVEGTQAM